MNAIQRAMIADNAIEDVRSERRRQEQLKCEGRFAYTCADPELLNAERLIMLLRELGEVAHAVHSIGDRRKKLLAQQTAAHLRIELVQVAAVAVAWIEALDAQEVKP